MAQKPRSNPNQPLSEQQANNADAQDALAKASGEDTSSFPDDPAELKKLLLDATKKIEVLDLEATASEQKIAGLEKAARKVDVLQAQVEKSIADTTSKFRPLLGYHDEKYGVECIAAPISDQVEGTLPMLIVTVLDGKPTNGFHVDLMKVVLKPEGYRISGHVTARR